MRSCGAEEARMEGVVCVGCAEVEEVLLLGEGCCDREEDGDIGGGGVFENLGKWGEVGNFGLIVFEEEIEMAMGVDKGCWEGCGGGVSGLGGVHCGMICRVWGL